MKWRALEELKDKSFMALLNCNAEVAFNDSRAFFFVVVVVLLFFVFPFLTACLHRPCIPELHMNVTSLC